MNKELLSRVLPLHVACLGEWRGTYTLVDEQSRIVARHDSHLACELAPEGADYDFHQVNRYTHPDGRAEEYVLRARVVDGRMRYDSERMRGYAEEQGDARTMFVKWVRFDLPREEFFEMIQLDESVTHRFRVWARYREGMLVGRTLINEARVA